MSGWLHRVPITGEERRGEERGQREHHGLSLLPFPFFAYFPTQERRKVVNQPAHLTDRNDQPNPQPTSDTAANMITGLHHINLTVPEGTLDQATSFYADTLGLTPRPVPAAQTGRLAWFDIIPPTSSSSSSSSPSATTAQQHQQQPVQQVHIAFGKTQDFEHLESTRHPCFHVGTPQDLRDLQHRVHAHFERGGPGAPRAADKPGEENSGAKGVEYPTRFFARDFAGNRLEFTL